MLGAATNPKLPPLFDAWFELSFGQAVGSYLIHLVLLLGLSVVVFVTLMRGAARSRGANLGLSTCLTYGFLALMSALTLYRCLPVEALLHHDTLHDLMMAKECADGPRCALTGVHSTFAEIHQGGFWILHLAIFEKLGWGIEGVRLATVALLIIAHMLIAASGEYLAGRTAGILAATISLLFHIAIQGDWALPWNPTLLPLPCALFTASLLLIFKPSPLSLSPIPTSQLPLRAGTGTRPYRFLNFQFLIASFALVLAVQIHAVALYLLLLLIFVFIIRPPRKTGLTIAIMAGIAGTSLLFLSQDALLRTARLFEWQVLISATGRVGTEDLGAVFPGRYFLPSIAVVSVLWAWGLAKLGSRLVRKVRLPELLSKLLRYPVIIILLLLLPPLYTLDRPSLSSTSLQPWSFEDVRIIAKVLEERGLDYPTTVSTLRAPFQLALLGALRLYMDLPDSQFPIPKSGGHGDPPLQVAHFPILTLLKSTRPPPRGLPETVTVIAVDDYHLYFIEQESSLNWDSFSVRYLESSPNDSSLSSVESDWHLAYLRFGEAFRLSHTPQPEGLDLEPGKPCIELILTVSPPDNAGISLTATTPCPGYGQSAAILALDGLTHDRLSSERITIAEGQAGKTGTATFSWCDVRQWNALRAVPFVLEISGDSPWLEGIARDQIQVCPYLEEVTTHDSK